MRSSRPCPTKHQDAVTQPEPAPPRSAPNRRLYQDIRYYVDEDMLGLGHAMMWARTDTVTCGHPLVEAEIPRETPDEDWIRIVARHGWVSITGNRKIRTNPIEISVAIREAAKIVCVHDPRGSLNTWDKLTRLTQWWTRVSTFVDKHPSGPWWLSVTPSGPRELQYPSQL
jgi:hypothetical protein